VPTFAPDWPIRTERLTLRPWKEDDFDVLERIYSDEEVTRYLYYGVRRGDEIRELLHTKMAGAAVSAEEHWLGAAATLHDSDEVVADISLQWVSELHKQGEIGFAVVPGHQGNGYATEGAAALLDFAFGPMGLHRVFGRIEPRNLASARVLEKLGMRKEAHLVENGWIKDEWQSEAIYALLARDWDGGPRRRP
jgi:RimJ/RimL family protein N-acetyltransferase